MNIDSHNIFSNYDLNKINGSICLSDNPKTGLFLKENTHLINLYYLSTNMNNWVIDFIFDQDIIHLINFKEFNCYNNDKIVEYLLNNPKYLISSFFKNSNNIAVNFCINFINNTYEDKYIKTYDYIDKLFFFKEQFNANTNDKVVEYLLNNPDKINYNSFVGNNNDKVVDYILKNIDNIDNYGKSILSSNTNNRIIDYLINNPKLINVDSFCYNSNDKAVKYIINNNYHKKNEFINSIVQNKNNKMFDYILNECGYDCLYISIMLNNNPRLIDFYQNVDKINERIRNYMKNILNLTPLFNLN